MKKIALCLFVFVVTASLVSSASARGFGRRGSSSGGGSSSASQALPLEQFEGPVLTVEERLLERVNVERARYGLVALVLDPILKLSARRHCAWMVRTRSMTHGVGVAENIAMGQHDTDDVVNSWMNSSGHRANILNPSHTKAGMVGYVEADGTPFWCQQFSR